MTTRYCIFCAKYGVKTELIRKRYAEGTMEKESVFAARKHCPMHEQEGRSLSAKTRKKHTRRKLVADAHDMVVMFKAQMDRMDHWLTGRPQP